MAPRAASSIPGLNSDVRRAEKVTVKGLDRDGKAITVTATGSVRAFQHEIDHLDGVLFTDIADKVYEVAPEQPGLTRQTGE